MFWLLDMPALQHLLRQSRGYTTLAESPAGDHVVNRSFYGHARWRSRCWTARRRHVLRDDLRSGRILVPYDCSWGLAAVLFPRLGNKPSPPCPARRSWRSRRGHCRTVMIDAGRRSGWWA